MAKNRKVKLPLILNAVFALAIIVFLTVLVVRRYGDYKTRLEPAPRQPVRVQTVTVSGSKVTRTLERRGFVESTQVHHLYFRTQGRVKWVKKRNDGLPLMPGDAVKKGEVLAKLADEIEQSQIKLAQARLAWADAELRRAQETLSNANELLGLTQKEYEIKKNQLKSGYMVDSAKIALGKVKIKVKDLKIDVYVAYAKKAEMQAEKNTANAELEKTVITSPIDGVVILQDLRVGDYSGLPGNEKSCPITIADPNSLWVKTYLMPEQAALIPKNCKAEMCSEKDPGLTLGTGRLSGYRLRKEGDMLVAMVSFKKKKAKIFHGQQVKVRFLLKREEALLAPENTLVYRNDKIYAYVVDGDNACRKAVITGEIFPKGIEIVSGIEKGNRLVSAGRYHLYDGQEVKIDEGSNNEIEKEKEEHPQK